MRILFWSEGFWPLIGGAEIFGANFVSALQKRGHEFIVVTSKDLAELPEEAKYKGIPIYRFPFHRALSGSEIDQVFVCRGEVGRLKHTFQLFRFSTCWTHAGGAPPRKYAALT